MKDQVLEWLRSGKDLPVLTSTATKVMQLAVKGTVPEKLAQAILESPTLTGKVLRLVNSSFYGFPQKVSTVQHAIVILGFRTVCNLVLSISIVDSFTSDKRGSFDHKKFCRDAFCAAIAADMLSRSCGDSHLEESFVLGLLHDIGEMIIARLRPEAFESVLQEKQGSGCSMMEAERRALGTDHAELGAIISEEWQLPYQISQAIRYHHEPEFTAPDHPAQKLSRILYLSDIMVEIFRGEDGLKTSRFAKEANRLFGLSQDKINSVLFSFAGKVEELAAIFEMGAIKIKDYSQILQDANIKLGEINVEYDALIKKMDQQQESLITESSRVRESEQKYRLLFENASDAIAILDLNGAILEANQQFCRMVGHANQEISGHAFHDFVTKDGFNKLVKTFSGLKKVDNSRPKSMEFVLKNATGHMLYVEVKLNPLFKDGHLNSFQSIMRDVTDRRRQEDLRVQKEKLAGVIEMASGASHELAQPMTALLGLTDLLTLRMPASDNHRGTIEVISRLAHKMADITQKLGRITRYILKEYPGGIRIVDIHEASKPLSCDSRPDL